jgi:hypothetical protein
LIYITEIEKYTNSVHLETQETIIPKKNNVQNVGGITMPNFKLYYRAIAIKTSWYKKQI